MTAQEILKLIINNAPKNIFRMMAEKYVVDPHNADKFVREIHEQTFNNRDQCIKAVTLEVVEAIEKYVTS